MGSIFLSVFVLCAITGGLTILLLIAESYFRDYGECEILVNDGTRKFTVKGGASLLSTLGEQKLFLPSGCGGRGSCGICKCRVIEGGGPVLPTETPYLTPSDLENQTRLSCQVRVRENVKIAIPEELLSIREFWAPLVRIQDLTYDIKGLRFELPEGETVSFKAGQYFNVVAPPYGEITTPNPRAYSIASAPSDQKALEFIIRLVPNGITTTYVFTHLKVGDKVQLIGPFGEFFLRDSDREIICIAGGSGLAPIRSIIFDLIDRNITHRQVKFFFGAVRTRDLYFVEEFKTLEQKHSWLKFIPALSGPETDHSYERGLITDVVARHYETLDHHEAYLCGSPGMINACITVLTKKGLPESLVFFDKFS